jgi:dephospho-CoA kinase
MHVFGLTGGVASGKTVVARFLSELGTTVVDADDLARQAVVKASPVLGALVQRFGSHILSPDGELNRRALAQEVFGHPDKVLALNAIVHPRVAELLRERLAELQSQGQTLVCYSAPLLFENQLADRFRPVVLVAAPQQLQLERARVRNGWSDAETLARIAAQMPLERKRALADFVIDNGGTLAETREQTRRVMTAIQERFT